MAHAVDTALPPCLPAARPSRRGAAARLACASPHLASPMILSSRCDVQGQAALYNPSSARRHGKLRHTHAVSQAAGPLDRRLTTTRFGTWRRQAQSRDRSKESTQDRSKKKKAKGYLGAVYDRETVSLSAGLSVSRSYSVSRKQTTDDGTAKHLVTHLKDMTAHAL